MRVTGFGDLADRAINLLVRGYFTKTNFLLHILVYPILMSLEGGDFHLFLDGISIEAVFVGLMVGISTKTIIEHNHHLRSALHEAVEHFMHPHEQEKKHLG